MEKERTLEDCETDLTNLQIEINNVLDERESLQLNLTSLKKRLGAGMLPTHHFKQVNEAREEFKRDLNLVLKRHRALKVKKLELNNEREYFRNNDNILSSKDIISDLQLLKDKYFEFYRDKTRIASMRNMAKEFIVDVDKVIKKAKK